MKQKDLLKYAIIGITAGTIIDNPEIFDVYINAHIKENERLNKKIKKLENKLKKVKECQKRKSA